MAFRNSIDENNEPTSSNSSRQARRNLPRRARLQQHPFYVIDLEDEDDDQPSHHSNRRIMRRSLTESSSYKKTQNNEPATILNWLLEMKVLKENTIVRCLNSSGTRTQEIGRGMINRRGIHCFCCGEEIPVCEFPRHRGDCSVIHPYQSIVIQDTGVSLLTCQIEAWNRHSVPAKNGYYHVSKQAKVTDYYDDCCMICGDGGELMCCEKCPSTYHPRCLGLEGVPEGEWHCPYCHCRYCDRDCSQELLLTCVQCLKKYHWRCSEYNDRIHPSHQPSSMPFCGRSCWQVYTRLERLVGRNMCTGQPGVYWTLIRRMDLDVTRHDDQNEDLYRRANCSSMVVVATKVMEDSFKLMIDRQTRMNIVESVMYSCGSNFIRTNFSRFYIAALVLRGQIITVASLRMPSPNVIEVPFIATAEQWRNKGMCTLLLSALEIALADMEETRILIPSAEGMVANWQCRFGFKPIDEAMTRQIITLNTLVFPGTTRLYKVIRRALVNDLNCLM